MTFPSEEEVKKKLFKEIFSELSHSAACEIIDMVISAKVDEIYAGMTEEERVEVLKEND